MKMMMDGGGTGVMEDGKENRERKEDVGRD